jgi:3,4-dihydroxy-2-butanone 4-phosphate synthase
MSKAAPSEKHLAGLGAIAAIGRGEMIIMVDDEDRGTKATYHRRRQVTPEAINMAKHAAG